ncbi:hypothetical protein [Kitasatospora sp. NPDC056531]|uniref:hypothetical protein n=1 Tax=Kitasatospora sp. NPDC056531 TaxID=3345856 RepID=UPI003684CBC2
MPMRARGCELYARRRPAPDDTTLVRSVRRGVADALDRRLDAALASVEDLRARESALPGAR